MSSEKNISIKDVKGLNNLDACKLDDGVCIEVFEFACELTREDSIKLRDFLNDVLDYAPALAKDVIVEIRPDDEYTNVNIKDNPELINTVEGCVEDIRRIWEREHSDLIKKFIESTDDELILYHHTLGRFIRNRYKLWDNPELISSCKDKIEVEPDHPDSVSQYIIEQLHARMKSSVDI